MNEEQEFDIVTSEIINQYDALIKHYIDQKMQELKEEILAEINNTDISV